MFKDLVNIYNMVVLLLMLKNILTGSPDPLFLALLAIINAWFHYILAYPLGNKGWRISTKIWIANSVINIAHYLALTN